jgi:hypothetical protein
MFNSMRESEYLRLKAQIEKEFKYKLEALDTIYKMSSTNGHHPDSNKPKRRRRNGGLNSTIKPLLPELKQIGFFGQPKVLEMLRTAQPELEVTAAAVSSALRRLAEDGDIDLVEQGAGQRASTYRVK